MSGIESVLMCPLQKETERRKGPDISASNEIRSLCVIINYALNHNISATHTRIGADLHGILGGVCALWAGGEGFVIVAGPLLAVICD